MKIYFFKGPNLTFGLIPPVVLYLAFAMDRTDDPAFAFPGYAVFGTNNWDVQKKQRLSLQPSDGHNGFIGCVGHSLSRCSSTK